MSRVSGAPKLYPIPAPRARRARANRRSRTQKKLRQAWCCSRKGTFGTHAMVLSFSWGGNSDEERRVWCTASSRPSKHAGSDDGRRIGPIFAPMRQLAHVRVKTKISTRNKFKETSCPVNFSLRSPSLWPSRSLHVAMPQPPMLRQPMLRRPHPRLTLLLRLQQAHNEKAALRGGLFSSHPEDDLVRSRRLELPRLATQRPQRCASTNSATTARLVELCLSAKRAGM